jgi:hypothetical protein
MLVRFAGPGKLAVERDAGANLSRPLSGGQENAAGLGEAGQGRQA